MTPELSAAVDAAYAAFAHRRLAPVGRPGDDYCAHCVTASDDALLRTTPVRELPMDLVGSFLLNSGTWGAVPERRRVLPRALEGTASGELWTDPELTIRTIGRADPDGFTPDEREAVMGWVAAWWPGFATDPDVPEDEVDDVHALLASLRLSPGSRD